MISYLGSNILTQNAIVLVFVTTFEQVFLFDLFSFIYVLHAGGFRNPKHLIRYFLMLDSTTFYIIITARFTKCYFYGSTEYHSFFNSYHQNLPTIIINIVKIHIL